MLVSFETLPWACRYVEYGSVVEILGAKVKVDVACHPFAMTSPACQVLKQLLSREETHTLHEDEEYEKNGEGSVAKIPHFQACSNQLAITLMNINSVWHPCITYGRFHGTFTFHT